MMFDIDSRKRPSPERLDENITLKKLCTIPNERATDTPNSSESFQNRTFEQHRKGLISPISHSLSHHPETNLGSCATYSSSTRIGNLPLLTFTDHDGLGTSNSYSDDGLALLDDVPSLEDEDIGFRACFGVLNMTVTSIATSKGQEEAVSVDLEEFGEMVKMKFRDSGNYAGLIRSTALCELLGDATVELSATLTLSSPMKSKPSRKRTYTSSFQLHSYTARIIVVGLEKFRHRVGRLLSDSHLFLQEPYIEECGGFEYRNPHYFVRPGGSMPQLQHAAALGEACAKPLGSLTEVETSRILRIFDSATSQGQHENRSHNLSSPRLKSDLKPHQIIAVAMMLNREHGDVECNGFPSVWETTKSKDSSKRYRNKITGVYHKVPTPLNGGVIADDMGLGKTFTTLALLCISLDYGRDHGNGNGYSLYPTLVVTTKSTLPGWLSQIDRHVHSGQLRTALYHGPNRHTLGSQFQNYDAILTTYETLRSERETKGPLYQNQWGRLVLDEAHHIRNRASQIFLAVCSVKSYYRWCLTGTPVHNSLDDYGALLSFLGIPGLTEKATFDYWITKPIQEKKPEGFTRLQTLVRSTCLRRTKESIGDALCLPLRHERVESIYLHQQDQTIYNFFKQRSADIASGTKVINLSTPQHNGAQDGGVITLLNFLRLICNHGEQLLPQTALQIWNNRNTLLDDLNEVEMSDANGAAPRYSAKTMALLNNLIAAHTPQQDSPGRNIPVKSVVFSYWTKMLDLIQQALSDRNFKTCRIDGGTSVEGRKAALNMFDNDADCSVMLATIGSAGEGLDLTVANHVHLIEPHWNPMAEAQAVDRVYRIGQQREVFVTRYIVPNSIETYIQWVQQQKLKLVSKFADTEGVTQGDIDTERSKQLRENLGCEV